ncbi:MAG: PepSY-associated TM helix domain-containing protein [Xanthobacteraceae bacterium]|uniref:PepSY-associated TM helix domain-containing protein n=1 Tax=Pseudolabrys sp. TaxID=1960880 RepID=UPI003D10F3A3
MATSRTRALRQLWLNIHLWIGIGLAILLIPISISGGLLVFHDEFDGMLNPHRYAVSGPQRALPLSDYLARAGEAVAGAADDLRPAALRLPAEPGAPLQVQTRAQKSEPGQRPRFVTVYLDPPTGRVLDVVDFRASLFGFLHVFHENLTIPQYSGRQIVGWAGVGMLILSLSGIYLWWPRGGFLRGLRWSRSTRFTYNLHHMTGFWISIPLAAVSLTGIYLSFPQTARTAMASVATMTPPGPRGFGPVVAAPTLTADKALDIALAQNTGATARAIFLPAAARGNRGPAPAWRVQMERADGMALNVTVSDRDGTAAILPAPQSGDKAARWIRWIHEGSNSGPVWKALVFATGVLPTVFAVTGTIMWLRRRAVRRGAAAVPETQLRPAE